jgi:hypothetical protein
MYKHGLIAFASVLFGFALPIIAGERPPGAPLRLTPSEVVLSVDQDALDRQYQALSAMPSVNVTYSDLGLIRVIEGNTGIVLSNQARGFKKGDSATEVLDKLRDVLLASGAETLTVRLNTASRADSCDQLDQSIRGIPVIHGVSHRWEATRIVRSRGHISCRITICLNQSQSSTITLATTMLETQGVAKPGTVTVSETPTLGYHAIFPNSTRARLVWAVTAFYISPDTGERSDGIFWIDAVDGEYVGTEPYSVAALNRTAYSANGGAPLEWFPRQPHLLVREGYSWTSSDQIAIAYNMSASVYGRGGV